MFNIFKMFKRKERNLLTNGLNNDVVEGFIDKIEDIVCIVDSEYKIDYINKPDMSQKYNYLFELLSYNENKELYNEIIDTTKEEGFYSGNIEIVKKMKKQLCI